MVKIMEMGIRDLAGRPWRLIDLLQTTVSSRAGDEIQASGVYARLER
jgi:hypothetical protein